MKTFRITFTSDPESGIYSANLVNAKSAEQATAYFQTLGKYEIVGCTETNEEPKPGQPRKPQKLFIPPFSRMVGKIRKPPGKYSRRITSICNNGDITNHKATHRGG